MFDQLLHTFLQVVECKSFSAAAKQLFLTPNAVKKRIESLEQQTGVLLFHRSNQGSSLTRAGESLYEDLLVLNRQYSAAISRARYLQDQSKAILSIGIMSTFAESFMTASWFDIRKKLRSQSMQLVHYGSSLSDFEELFRDVGTVTHVCVDVYEEERARKYHLAARKISSFALCIGLPDTLEPPSVSPLTLSDLPDAALALPWETRASAFDAIRNAYLKAVPGGALHDLGEYTVRSVNDCYLDRCCLLAPQNMLDHYPFYKFFPLADSPVIEFGLYYRKSDEAYISDFLNAVIPPADAAQALHK